MTIELPEGWVHSDLDSLLREPLRNGHSARASSDGSGVRTLTLSAVTYGDFSEKNTKLTVADPAKVSDLWLQPGDLLIERSNTPELVGTTRLYEGAPRFAIFPDLVIRARFAAAAVPRFMELALQQEASRNYFTGSAQGSAGSMPKIDQGVVARLLVALPPVAEQRRIVSKVEALLTAVDASRERLAKASSILKRFRMAALEAACSGTLTEDWRGKRGHSASAAGVQENLRAGHEDHGTGRRRNAATPTEEVHDLDASDLPKGWVVSELQWLCEPGRPITYGILKPGPHRLGGVPYVRVTDFPKGAINVAGVKRTSSAIADAYRRSTLREGDVLLSIRGTFGRVCRVPRELAGGNITQDTARLTIAPGINPDYVALYLRSPSAQRRMKKCAKGVAVHGVNIGDVRALQVALPPTDEQEAIVQRVAAFMTLADAIDRRLAAATARANKLTQAILAKAFRGELVPTEAELARKEGRDYEPASLLLERLRGERATAGAAVPGADARRGGRRLAHPGRRGAKKKHRKKERVASRP